MTNAVSIRNLKKSYNDTVALKGIDITINDGEFFGLLGPNGAGKTTTINILTGFVRKNEGDAKIFDKDTVKHISKLARISLEEKKIDSLSKDLSSIMKFIEKLNELDTDKIIPLTSIINASLKSREDEVKDGKIRDQILKNSPEKNEEFFVVPKVVD